MSRLLGAPVRALSVIGAGLAPALSAVAVLALAWSMAPSPVTAQSQPRLDVERQDGRTSRLAVQLDRGYAAVPLSVLEELGWMVEEDGNGVTVSAAGEIAVSMRLDSPFFRWDGIVLQLTDAPYRAGSRTYVPLQFLTDFLPRRLPDLYQYQPQASLLLAGDVSSAGTAAAREAPTDVGAGVGGEPETSGDAPVPAPPAESRPTAEDVRDAGPSVYEGVRVVVIDPGHGGVDPGALGPDGIREKEVALGIGLRVAEELRRHPDLEVHLIRDDDTFVDLWERGLIATDLKGERPGIFVSIHANSFPARRMASGFETYFLSDARTEHERRVSAIENAPLSMNPEVMDEEALDDLDFILRDLKNYDHAHWSENLAALVQEELHDVHPGPNRGVKQGVLAVLTNALMPSVLVEVGYLSNDDEGRLLGTEGFHEDAAGAIAEAVVRFFERYPPGSGFGSDREEP